MAWQSLAAPVAGGLISGGLSALGGGGGGWGDRYQKQMGRELRNATTELDKYWKPFQGNRFADTQSIYNQLFQGAGQLDPNALMAQGSGLLANMGSAPQYQAQMVDPSQHNVSTGNVNAMTPEQINAMTGQFMNPYQEQVIDRMRQSGDRALATRRVQDASRAAGLNAFGSSGAALEGAATTSDHLRNMGNMEAQLRNQGFSQAQAAAMGRAGAMEGIQGQNIANQMRAALANQQTGMQGDLANQAALAQQQGLNLQGRGQDLQRGQALAGLGSQQLQQLMGLGQVQQGLAQQQGDFDYEQYMRQMQYPFQRLAALQGSPVNFNTPTGQNPWLRGLGTAMGVGSQIYDFLNREGG